MNTVNNTIGKKIREARKQAGLTQLQLADSIYVSESYIALIETGKRNPSTTVLSKIAEALELTTDGLLLDPESRTLDSYTLEWQRLTYDRSAAEIETALQMLRSYFDCLDAFK